MKTMKHLWLSGSLAVLAAGCASGPTFSEYRSSLPPAPEGYGRIWVYRPSAMGLAVQPPVRMDGARVGRAVPHGYFHVEAKPGTYEISTTTEWTPHRESVRVSSKADTFVRLDMREGALVGHVVPSVVPERIATNQMNKLHLAVDKATQTKDHAGNAKAGASAGLEKGATGATGGRTPVVLSPE
jgi:hypothetical protein